MIVVTGADGFIGANLTHRLNERGRDDLVLVDDMNRPARHIDDLHAAQRLHIDEAPAWLKSHLAQIEAVVHLGACSDTTQTDRAYMLSNNTEYTRTLWRLCTEAQIPFVYASSAATYGDGAQGYSDQVDPSRYRPLNLYGESKHLFDLWALEQTKQAPPRWAGVKYFNVYGPREQHKGRMASVFFHAWNQVRETGKVRLFKSHRPDYPDGGQMRDFIHVGDAVDATLFLLDEPPSPDAPNGLYNVGSGKARTFEDLARAVFAAMDQPERIEFIPMPEDLRDKYQYFTEATIDKLRHAGFDAPMRSIEQGAADYIRWLEHVAV